MENFHIKFVFHDIIASSMKTEVLLQSCHTSADQT